MADEVSKGDNVNDQIEAALDKQIPKETEDYLNDKFIESLKKTQKVASRFVDNIYEIVGKELDSTTIPSKKQIEEILYNFTDRPKPGLGRNYTLIEEIQAKLKEASGKTKAAKLLIKELRKKNLNRFADGIDKVTKNDDAFFDAEEAIRTSDVSYKELSTLIEKFDKASASSSPNSLRDMDRLSKKILEKYKYLSNVSKLTQKYKGKVAKPSTKFSETIRRITKLVKERKDRKHAELYKGSVNAIRNKLISMTPEEGRKYLRDNYGITDVGSYYKFIGFSSSQVSAGKYKELLAKSNDILGSVYSVEKSKIVLDKKNIINIRKLTQELMDSVGDQVLTDAERKTSKDVLNKISKEIEVNPESFMLSSNVKLASELLDINDRIVGRLKDIGQQAKYPVSPGAKLEPNLAETIIRQGRTLFTTKETMHHMSEIVSRMSNDLSALDFDPIYGKNLSHGLSMMKEFISYRKDTLQKSLQQVKKGEALLRSPKLEMNVKYSSYRSLYEQYLRGVSMVKHSLGGFKTAVNKHKPNKSAVDAFNDLYNSFTSATGNIELLEKGSRRGSPVFGVGLLYQDNFDVYGKVKSLKKEVTKYGAAFSKSLTTPVMSTFLNDMIRMNQERVKTLLDHINGRFTPSEIMEADRAQLFRSIIDAELYPGQNKGIRPAVNHAISVAKSDAAYNLTIKEIVKTMQDFGNNPAQHEEVLNKIMDNPRNYLPDYASKNDDLLLKVETEMRKRIDRLRHSAIPIDMDSNQPPDIAMVNNRDAMIEYITKGRNLSDPKSTIQWDGLVKSGRVKSGDYIKYGDKVYKVEDGHTLYDETTDDFVNARSVLKDKKGSKGKPIKINKISESRYKKLFPDNRRKKVAVIDVETIEGTAVSSRDIESVALATHGFKHAGKGTSTNIEFLNRDYIDLTTKDFTKAVRFKNNVYEAYKDAIQEYYKKGVKERFETEVELKREGFTNKVKVVIDSADAILKETRKEATRLKESGYDIYSYTPFDVSITGIDAKDITKKVQDHMSEMFRMYGKDKIGKVYDKYINMVSNALKWDKSTESRFKEYLSDLSPGHITGLKEEVLYRLIVDPDGLRTKYKETHVGLIDAMEEHTLVRKVLEGDYNIFKMNDLRALNKSGTDLASRQLRDNVEEFVSRFVAENGLAFSVRMNKHHIPKERAMREQVRNRMGFNQDLLDAQYKSLNDKSTYKKFRSNAHMMGMIKYGGIALAFNKVAGIVRRNGGSDKQDIFELSSGTGKFKGNREGMQPVRKYYDDSVYLTRMENRRNTLEKLHNTQEVYTYLYNRTAGVDMPTGQYVVEDLPKDARHVFPFQYKGGNNKMVGPAGRRPGAIGEGITENQLNEKVGNFYSHPDYISKRFFFKPESFKGDAYYSYTPMFSGLIMPDVPKVGSMVGAHGTSFSRGRSNKDIVTHVSNINSKLQTAKYGEMYAKGPNYRVESYTLNDIKNTKKWSYTPAGTNRNNVYPTLIQYEGQKEVLPSLTVDKPSSYIHDPKLKEVIGDRSSRIGYYGGTARKTRVEDNSLETMAYNESMRRRYEVPNANIYSGRQKVVYPIRQESSPVMLRENRSGMQYTDREDNTIDLWGSQQSGFGTDMAGVADMMFRDNNYSKTYMKNTGNREFLIYSKYVPTARY